MSKSFFKNVRWPANGRVRTHDVIKAFDVGKNGVLSTGAGIDATQMDEFSLQAAEEINGVVVRIALTRHALTDTKLIQAVPIGSGSVLDAAVRVENEAMVRLFPADIHVQDGQHVLGVDAVGEGVANDLFRTQILDSGQIRPSPLR